MLLSLSLSRFFLQRVPSCFCILGGVLFLLLGTEVWAQKATRTTPTLKLPGKPYPRSTKKKKSTSKRKRRIPGKRYIPLQKRSHTTQLHRLPGQPVGRTQARSTTKKKLHVHRTNQTHMKNAVRSVKFLSRNVFVIDPSVLKRSKMGLPLSKDSRRVLTQEHNREIKELRRQIAADTMPIPPRLGGIFVPNIIRRNSDVRSTSYSLFDMKGNQVAVARTGRKSFVFPGWYVVQIGGRTTDLLPRYKVRVERGKLTIIRPRWAALVIRVVDERLIQFRGTYDIIHLGSRRSIGTGIGADGTLGEKVRPWLLQPGLYMIVRVGDSYLARTNFFTVQVNQGKVTQFRLVMNKNSGSFLGGGVLIQKKNSKRAKKTPWRWSFQLNGTFLWSQVENVPGNTSGHNFSLTTFLFGRLAYNTKRHFFLTTLNTELGFTLPSLSDLRKSGDRLELQSIYIFRLFPFLGPYIRAGLDVSMFPDVYTFGPNDPRLLEAGSVFVCKDKICKKTRSAEPGGLKQVELSGPFDPFLLRQGLGINVQAVRRSFLDLRILLGLGFRQDVARSVFQLNTNADIADSRCKDPSKRNPNNPTDLTGCPLSVEQEPHTTVRLLERPSTHREGLEMAIVATGRISRFVTFTTELDSLINFRPGQFRLDIDWRTAVTIRLSHYAAIIYRLRIRRDSTLTPAPNNPELSLWSLDQSVLLSFSLLL